MAAGCASPSAIPTSALLLCGKISPEGKNLHPVLPGWNKPSQEFGGTWTPDGKYSLFESTRDHTQNIWALREATSLLRDLFRKADTEPTQLTVGPLLFSNPDAEPGWKETIRHWPAAPLRFDPTRWQVEPILYRFAGRIGGEADTTRNSEWIVYVSHPDLTLWRSKADGTSRMQLTYAPMLAHMPRWSPTEPRSHSWRHVRESMEDICDAG